MKTLNPTQLKNIERKWYEIDAKGQTLWRLATKIATILRWKNKVNFAPYVDNWDYVVVLNATKVVVTWNKLSDKVYRTHSWHMWSLKETNLASLNAKKPTEALRLAVSWMLPKNKLHDDMLLRLKLEVGSSHKFEAQKPIKIEL
ncbi:MAG: 50S ribosomal protein L13 [uncultured bacterium (gcode 4)]|uniref:Large ribosomal subunit protein uL13 n=1 Tax=uncultured bacterium (gcode 4) TaxID=1234023 RepID=K2FST7_9BACT|nr:MAG: 50S ribosomal protein L13 [uncultured bacterium (gcode 4)]